LSQSRLAMGGECLRREHKRILQQGTHEGTGSRATRFLKHGRDAMAYVRLIAGLACVLVVSLPARGAGADSPDMSGAWSRLTFGFEEPPSGPGPIGRYNNQSNVGGNFNNPI